MTVFLIILGIIVVILVIPFGVNAAYIDGIFSLAARVAFITIKLFPRKKPKKPKKPQKPKKPKKQKRGKKKEQLQELPEGEAEAPEKKWTLEKILPLAKIGLDALKRFRRKITVSNFMLHFVSASDDPYDAAMIYGYANTALSVLLPVAENAFRVKKRDIKTAVDFEATEPVIDCEITLTINLWKLLCIFFIAGCAFLKLKIKSYFGKRRARIAEERMERDGPADAAEPNV